MNHCFRSALLLLLPLAGIGPVSFAQDTSTLNPKYRYLADAAALTAGETITGPSRVLDLKGRKGINPQSIHTVIKLGAHNLNDPKGTVVLWFFALEDQVFRLDAKMSASAYKHSTAHVLHELGIIASPEAHPACKDLRGADEAARMAEALRRPIRVAERMGIPFAKPETL